MPRLPSEIPVGTQFSPALINLRPFLKAARKHSGNRKALLAATWTPPVHRKEKAVPSSERRAKLPLEAAAQYGLLKRRTWEMTKRARRLLKHKGAALYEQFAKHILLRCGGLRMVEGVEQMHLAGLPVTGDSLARYLTQQGFRVREHNTAINTMRLWLAKARLFPPKGWVVNQEVKRQLVPLSDEAISILTGFSPEHRAFVEALCRINPSGWYKASDVRDLAEATRAVRLGRGSLPKDVLEPLQRAGLIDYRTGGTAGGKAAELKTTEAFDKKVLEPFITVTAKSLDPVVTGYYKKRPQDIYAEMASTDKFKKGQARSSLDWSMAAGFQRRVDASPGDWR